MKIQKAIKDETLHITLGVLGLSLVAEAVFALLGRWDMTVLYGNLLGGAYAILNFFILGLTVQKVANDGDEKRGKNWMQFSYSTRMFLTVVVVFIGITMKQFNWIMVLLCQFFPRITIAMMGFSGKHAKDAKKEQEMKAAATKHTEMLRKEVPLPKKKSAQSEQDADAVDAVDSAPKVQSVEVAEAEAEAAEAEAEAAAAKARAARARAKAAALKAEQGSSDENR